MIKILILADDITGALDTGIKFAANGASTIIATDRIYDFMKNNKNIEILVINTETRHIPSEEAYTVIYEIVKRAVLAGIPHIYKKTDSALRGNIGSDLCALLDATEEKVLPFLPAYPQMNRLTIQGTHYINQVPVHLSEFGKDPFEPVTSSYVPDIIRKQKNVYIETRSNADIKPFLYRDDIKTGIYVFDTEKEDDLLPIAQNLKNQTGLKIMAGCAGFASILPKIFGLKTSNQKKLKFHKKFLVICGSVNKITGKQLDYAGNHGFWRGHLTPEQKVELNYFDSDTGKSVTADMIEVCRNHSCMIIDTGSTKDYEETQSYAAKRGLTVEDIRIRLTKNYASLTKKILEAEPDLTLMITGGDTLTGFLNEIKCNELIPIGEMEPGTVLTKFLLEEKEFYVISKSGGFGDEKLIINLAEKIMAD
jgi:uncharacterized protein YgbK (DUF1537 family)